MPRETRSWRPARTAPARLRLRAGRHARPREPVQGLHRSQGSHRGGHRCHRHRSLPHCEGRKARCSDLRPGTRDFRRPVWRPVSVVRWCSAPRSGAHSGPRSPRRSAFYLGWIVIDDPVLAVFATLGVIGLLVLADFGGDLERQARAYVLATAIAGCAGRARDRRVRAHVRGRRPAVRGRAVRLAVHGDGAQRRHRCERSAAVLPGRLRRSGADRRPGVPSARACCSAAASRWWPP